jgi:uncharacterized metal-binding protein YceD (DUF177 family)
MTDPFGHNLKLDQIGEGQRIDLAADQAECSAICKRLGLDALDRLEAHAVLSRTGDTVRATGRLAASVTQSCVVTGEPVAAHVDEPFELVFMREQPPAAADHEIELDPNDCDVVFYDGGTIDLGGAIADTLALCLDPYPRSASAESALKEAGVLSEDQASPFAVLAALKGRMEED